MASKLASKIDSRNVFLLLLFVFSFLNLIPFSVVAVADTAQYYYDPDGRLVGVVDSLNGSAQYSYDATGNILSVATSPATAVSVVGYNPPTAIAGAVITIGGTGYDTAADTTVNFNGTPATPSAVTATTITVAVPAGATTGPVTVTAPAGTGASTASFIVAPVPAVPQIASFTPTAVTPGDTLTIAGSNFDPVNGRVKINGVLALVTSATATSLVVTVPSASTGRITVESSAGSAVSSSYLIVAPSGVPAGSIVSSQQAIYPSAGASVSATASINTAGQLAIIYFDVTAPADLSVFETSSTLVFGGFSLVGPDGTVVSLPSQIVQRSGTYSIVLTSNSFGNLTTGSANFLIYNLPPLSLAPTLIVGGAAGTETVTTPGQVPTFTFAGTAGQTIQVVVQTDRSNNSNFNLTLVDPDGLPIQARQVLRMF